MLRDSRMRNGNKIRKMYMYKLKDCSHWRVRAHGYGNCITKQRNGSVGFWPCVQVQRSNAKSLLPSRELGCEVSMCMHMCWLIWERFHGFKIRGWKGTSLGWGLVLCGACLFYSSWNEPMKYIVKETKRQSRHLIVHYLGTLSFENWHDKDPFNYIAISEL